MILYGPVHWQVFVETSNSIGSVGLKHSNIFMSNYAIKIFFGKTLFSLEVTHMSFACVDTCFYQDTFMLICIQQEPRKT